MFSQAAWIQPYLHALFVLSRSSANITYRLWAVDREFVHILGLSGEFSNSFWHDFELFWLSGVCSGLSTESPGALSGGSEARDEFSKFLWGGELSTNAYSDNIWPTGKIFKKKKRCEKHLFFCRELIARASRLAREPHDPHQLRL